MENNELYHHGIKGQKWGVRRYRNEDGTLTEAGKKRYDDKQARTAKRDDSKNRRLLSDADLKKKIERLRLEKQLKDLTDEEISPGKKFVSDVLKSSGTKVAGALLTGAALYGVQAALTKSFDVKKLAEYMTPKPKNK